MSGKKTSRRKASKRQSAPKTTTPRVTPPAGPEAPERTPSAWETLNARIGVLPGSENLAVMSDDEVKAFAKSAEIPLATLQPLVQAQRLSAQTAIDPALFFAFIKLDMGSDLNRLLTSTNAQLRDALQAAIGRHIVPESFGTQADDALARFDGLRYRYGPLQSAADAIGVKAPPKLIESLATLGIKSLDDIRRAGGLGEVEGLPVSTDDPMLKKLDAAAQFTVLSSDAAVGKALMKAGYTGLAEVARSSPREFQQRVEKALPAPQAAAVRNAAKTQALLINNYLTGVRVLGTAGSNWIPLKLAKHLPKRCHCCSDAASPLAYLADLLDYTVRHVKYDGTAVDLTFLEKHLHQPFSGLPIVCEDDVETVRQVRICIEVLRDMLPSPQKTYAPQWYLESAYRRLLDLSGTSFDEIREAQVASDRDRNILAQRLQIFINPNPQTPRQPDVLDALFQDPDGTTLNEQWLEHFFGLRDTTRSPLDPPITMSKLLGERLRYWKRQWRVADSGTWPLIDPDIVDYADLADATTRNNSHVVPLNKQEWTAADFLDDRKTLVDEAIVDLQDCRKPSNPPGAAHLTFSQMMVALASPNTVMGVAIGVTANLIDATATNPEVILKPLLVNRAKLQRGQDIGPWLSSVELSLDEFDLLSRMAGLQIKGLAITEREWDGFNSVIVQRAKRECAGQWLSEELASSMHITLTSEHFRLRAVSSGIYAWAPIAFRSDPAMRRRWENVLRSRIDLEQALRETAASAVDTVERELLAELRNELLREAARLGLLGGQAGLLTPARRKWFTNNLLIDGETAACAMTTRIEQAIETVQGLLFGIRNGLLDDTRYDLDDTAFDDIWRWLGSYETWRAAMSVFLYPENALRPTLRKLQSPGFTALVDALRSAGRVTVKNVEQAFSGFETYVADVANLTLLAEVYVNGTRAAFAGPGYPYLVYYVARSSTTGKYYFCWFDPELLLSGQSFWYPVDTLLHTDQVFGAVCYGPPESTLGFLYVFARRQADGQDGIIFTRLDLGLTMETFGWADAIPLDPLPVTSDSTEIAKLTLTNTSRAQPPEVRIWLRDRRGFRRSMNPDGTGWDATGPLRIPLTGLWKDIGEDRSLSGSQYDFLCSLQQLAPLSFVAADVDNDGIDELVVVPQWPAGSTTPPPALGNALFVRKYNQAQNAWIPLKTEELQLGPQANRLRSTVQYPPMFAVAGDFDGDRQAEIAAAMRVPFSSTGNINSKCLFWAKRFDVSTQTWLTLGNEISANEGISFHGDEWSGPIPGGPAIALPKFAVVADFNNDGREEIAVALAWDPNMDPVAITPNQRPGSTLAVFRFGEDGYWHRLPDMVCCDPSTNENLAAKFAVAGDFGGSGVKELAVCKDSQNTTVANDFWVMKWTGSGWSRQPVLDCSGASIAARSAVAGDFDGDGADELAIQQDSANGEHFWIMKRQSDGSWAQDGPDLTFGSAGSSISSAVAADIDGDGYIELIALSSDSHADFWWAKRDPDTNTWQISNGRNFSNASGNTFRFALAGKFDNPASDKQFAVINSASGGWVLRYAIDAITPPAILTHTSWIKPDINDPIRVIRRPGELVAGNILSAAALKTRSQDVFLRNGINKYAINLSYVEELLYYAPLEAAIRLSQAGLYENALDLLRTVFDYEGAGNARLVSYKLALDAGSPAFNRTLDWLKDPLNPHAIAATRKLSYLKYTILLTVQCLLSYADSEFTYGTPESINLARELYLKAIALLDTPEITARATPCDDLIGELQTTIGEDEWVWPEIKQIALGIIDRNVLANTIDKVRSIMKSSRPASVRLGAALGEVRTAQEGGESRTLKLVMTSANGLSASLAGVALAELSIPGGSSGRLPVIKVPAAGMIFPRTEALIENDFFNTESPKFVPAPSPVWCVKPNAQFDALRRHAEANLHKLRNCRNIAGLEVVFAAETAPTANQLDLANAESLSQLRALVQRRLPPLPYRYATLVERTKQLVELARQIEQAMLSSLLVADLKRFELLKARQDLSLAQAGVRLRDLQMIQAGDATRGADLQRDRAQLQTDEYNGRLSAGWSLNELWALRSEWTAVTLQTAAAAAAWAGMASPGTFVKWAGAAAGPLASSAQVLATSGQLFNQYASLERRDQDWRYQARLGEQEVQIANQQIRVAEDQEQVTAQERVIAGLQADHAATILDFLSTGEFGTVALYEWMSGVLEGIYRFFLQQATSLAQMAEAQLAFERQENPPTVIRDNYWIPPEAGMSTDFSPGTGAAADVKGLTGSARLLRDIYELDQYAFTTNQRKLQLTETISLAQLDPIAFQKFRQTGVLVFETPMELFNHRFPGHYLRLIRRVRTSVVALAPASVGIRATLGNSGLSSVVIGPDLFQTATIRRPPESVALSSAWNATGLFDLDIQPELLVPFEGFGVDTRWQLEMPKPANPFDYDSIADVMFTIEYTALNSYDYREQVLQDLVRDVSADRAFSFRNDFADAWYELNNPDACASPAMSVSFSVDRSDFPPNLDPSTLAMKHIAVLFAFEEGSATQVSVKDLSLTTPGGTSIRGGAANSDPATGIVSTRRGNAGSWNALIQQAPQNAPFGKWQLALTDSPALRKQFSDGKIRDILFVLTYAAQTPPWPQ